MPSHLQWFGNQTFELNEGNNKKAADPFCTKHYYLQYKETHTYAPGTFHSACVYGTLWKKVWPHKLTFLVTSLSFDLKS